MNLNDLKKLLSGRGDRGKKFCPLLSKPRPDCYCFNLDSQNIARALNYCQDNYLLCDIYQRVKNQAGRRSIESDPSGTASG